VEAKMNHFIKTKELISVCILLSLIIPNILYGDEPDQFAPYIDGIPEGCKLIQGDIIVPISVPEGTYNTNWWTAGNIPYLFDPNVTTTNRNAMLNAMAVWEAVANVEFVPRNGEDNHIYIQNSTINSSFVGMQGDRQIVNISDWGTRFVMVHELGHALGFWHEQSRPDRGDYVQINWGNMGTSQDTVVNFQMEPTADVYPTQAYGLVDTMTYDFDSVMHYRQDAFSNNGFPTITVLAPNQSWQDRIGQRTHLSFLDQLTMSFMYPENNWRFIDGTHTGPEIGLFTYPYTGFTYGMISSPSGSRLIIQPGTYSGVGRFNRPMTITAPLGHVVIGQ
jgi:hypothetical protein